LTNNLKLKTNSLPHLVFDARLYGPKHTGIGRYVKNLLLALKSQSKSAPYRFTVLTYQDQVKELQTDLGPQFNIIGLNPKYYYHYSIWEQFSLPLMLYRLRPHLVHIPHFNKPLFYFGPTVITIHDLIKHFSKGKETTTRSPLIYWFKFFGYLVLTWANIKLNYIIVPSSYWRDYIITNFHLPPHRIITTYEAVDPIFLKTTQSPKTENCKLKIENYLIYTGNLYPHKNLDIVISALKQLPSIRLKIICGRSVFSQRIQDLITQNHLQSQIEFLGYLPDQEFRQTYSQALALVHPAFIEGFSLTGLEAMALGCPVISSNSSCLPEIYQDSVLYFDPKDSSQLVAQISQLQKSPQLRRQLITRGYRQVAKYSWDRCAAQTLTYYQSILSKLS
jgi:glycosyltransferase involved in cell wall biosynthesis